MLTTQMPYRHPLDVGVYSGKAVVYFENSYVFLRSLFGKVFLRVVTFFLLWPFVLFFALWLKHKRKQLLIAIRDADEVTMTPEKYSDFREQFQKFDKLTPVLQKFNGYQPYKAKLVLRYSLTQMQKTCSTMLSFHALMKDKYVNEFNFSQFQNEATTFSFRSATELLNNRNKAYDYWM